jgi:hypothetical protein
MTKLYKPIMTHEKDGKTDFDLMMKNVDSNFAQMRDCDKAANQALPPSLLGRCFGIHVGDGAAYYQITRVLKSQVVVTCLVGLGDDWVDRYYGAESKISKSEAVKRLEVSGFI